MTTLYRDCGTLVTRTTPGRRCDACESPRLVSHRELATLCIAHVDCDAFYARSRSAAGRSWPIALSSSAPASVQFGRALPRSD